MIYIGQVWVKVIWTTTMVLKPSTVGGLAKYSDNATQKQLSLKNTASISSFYLLAISSSVRRELRLCGHCDIPPVNKTPLTNTYYTMAPTVQL